MSLQLTRIQPILSEIMIFNGKEGLNEEAKFPALGCIQFDSSFGTDYHKNTDIEFIVLETTSGIHIKWLKPGDTPVAVFHLSSGETVISAYEYCNLHGLWKA